MASSADAPAANSAIPVVANLGVIITVVCADAADTSAAINSYVGSPSALHLGTVATLTLADGSRIRMIDDIHTGPNIIKRDDGSWEIQIYYHPENSIDVDGKPTASVSVNSTVSTRLGGVLKALGLDPSQAKVSHLTLLVNGAAIVDQETRGSVSTEGAGFDPVILPTTSS